MVEDDNNFDEAREAFNEGLPAGLAELHQFVLDTTATNMTNGQDALGRTWPLVEPETLASRRTRTDDPRALLDTGEWRADLIATSEFDASTLTAIIGTTKEFAHVHEFGEPELGIPRRPLIGPAGTLMERHAEEYIGEEIDVRLERADLE